MRVNEHGVLFFTLLYSANTESHNITMRTGEIVIIYIFILIVLLLLEFDQWQVVKSTYDLYFHPFINVYLIY